ncbi:Phage integrase [Proteiniphilum saccharofermentans]|uniref:Phage integrase n=1 Tax=Proteiniphilum saccharofermentans TaxID=1642647 RepID=A0A1R3SSC6_9BACT|nr:site-specific integrase [Proteiniphilum saccharofermentans]SCD19246.1 Phage integrase [Proteiniphilum saccharofermentans]
MRSTFRVLFFLKRDKQKANGNVPIFCRITINKKETRFGIKKDINPAIWNVKAGRAIGRTDEAVEVNTLIDKIRTSLFNVYNEILLSDVDVTAEKVKNHFLGSTIKDHNLLAQFKRHNEDVKKLIGISKSKATYQKCEVTRKHLTNFIKEEYNLSDISFKEINHQFIIDFEVYLLSTCKCNPNTTAKFIQFLKRMVIIAKNNGWITTNPFANYKIRTKKVDRGYLTQHEIYTIMEKKFSTERLEKVRDIFIFSCFTGLAYIDVKNLRKSNISTSFDDRLWIMGKREKTGVNFNIPLLDIPKNILDKYEDTLPDDKVLPVLSNQKMNGYLKEIGSICGITKDLTFHLARHTFATLTLTKGVSIESVSKMLGHTNIKTTQIYARIIDEKVSQDMALFADKLEAKENNDNQLAV